MPRITPTHTMKIPPSLNTRETKISAWASQITRGVRLQVSADLRIPDRTTWEEFKLLVDRAFQDDENVPMRDNIVKVQKED